jgi:hypothetical protein
MFGHRNQDSQTSKHSKYAATQLRNINSNGNLEKSTHLKDMFEKKALLLSKFDRRENGNSDDDDDEYLSREKLLSNARQAATATAAAATITLKDETKVDPKKQVYPISLYNTQTKQYENFMKSIRQRNDTFYYVSFRRVSYKYFLLVSSSWCWFLFWKMVLPEDAVFSIRYYLCFFIYFFDGSTWY